MMGYVSQYEFQESNIIHIIPYSHIPRAID